MILSYGCKIMLNFFVLLCVFFYLQIVKAQEINKIENKDLNITQHLRMKDESMENATISENLKNSTEDNANLTTTFNSIYINYLLNSNNTVYENFTGTNDFMGIVNSSLNYSITTTEKYIDYEKVKYYDRQRENIWKVCLENILIANN